MKGLHKEKGYSQEEMAGLLEVSRQAVSKWESDRGTPEVVAKIRAQMKGLTCRSWGVSNDYKVQKLNPHSKVYMR